MKVVLSGGGTGGHVYPLLAIAERIKRLKKEAQFFYIGTKKGAESRIVRDMPFYAIHASAFPTSKFSFKLVVFSINFFIGLVESLFILRRIKPELVVVSGGYVSAPVVVASRLLGIPVLIHEQNLVPGRANRLLGRFAALVALTYEESRVFFPGARTVVVGYPLRKRIVLTDKEKARQHFGIKGDKFVVFVTGGSRGARSLNRAFAAIADRLVAQGFSVIHSTGLGSTGYPAFEDTKRILEARGVYGHPDYILREFIQEVDLAYSAADLVVCRAGAGTVEEIKKLRKPAIFVPKLGLPGEHQLSNVIPLKKAGACEILFEDYERGLDPDILLELLEELKRQPEKLEKMRSAYETLSSREVADIGEVALKLLQKKEGKEKRKQYVLIYKGKRYPLLFEKNTVGPGWLSSLRIKDLPVRFTLFIRNNRIVALFKGEKLEIRPGEEFSLEGVRLKIEVEEELASKEVDRSFVGRFASSAGGILLTRFFGFLREIVIGGFFGTTLKTDIFAVALMVANLFRRVLAENAMDNAFLPTFLRIKRRKGEEEAWKLAVSVAGVFFAVAAFLVVAGEVTIGSWFHLIAPGFAKKGVMGEAIRLTRLMLPFLAIITLSAWMASLIKAADRFGMAEGSAVLFDIGLILSVLLLTAKYDYFSLGYGVLAGGVAQLLFLAFILHTGKVKSRIGSPKFYWPSLKTSGVIVVLVLTLPILFDVLFSKMSDVVDKILATPLENGAVAALYFAAILFRLPVGVIGNSINNVVLRDFSSKIAAYRLEEARSVFIKGLRYQFLLLMPATLFILYFSKPIVRVVFQRGSFDERSVELTAGALALYSIAIISWGLHSLAGKMFAARLETKTAAITSAATITVNILLSILLVRTVLGYRGLALATALSLYFGAGLRLFILKGRMEREGMGFSWGQLLEFAWKSFLPALFGLGIAASVYHLLSGIELGSRFLSCFICLLFSWGLGLSFYLIFSVIFGLLPPLKGRGISSTSISIHLLPVSRLVDEVRKAPDRYREDMIYRTEALLRSGNWMLRNAGVKLAGILGYSHLRERLENLLLHDPVDFIRRNSAEALSQLPPVPSTVDALVKATRDRYFEVRSRACRALGRMGEASEEVRKALVDRLKDSYFEVKAEAIVALSLLFGEEILPLIRRFYYDSNFRLREACVNAIWNLLERGKIDRERAAGEVRSILDVSENFEPSFPIKAKIAKILKGK